MNVNKDSSSVELTYQNSLNHTSAIINKISKRTKEKQVYISPAIAQFFLSDIILNQIGSNSDGIAAQAQS